MKKFNSHFLIILSIIFLSGKLIAIDNFDISDPACKYVVMYPKNIDSIRVNVLEWCKGNDYCIQNLIDTLTDIYLNKSDTKILSCLTAVCNVADVKIQDNLIDANGMFFYGNFGNYIKYLSWYRSYYNEDHCLFRYLIDALSLEIKTSAKPKKAQQDLEFYMEKNSKLFKFTKREFEFLNYLKSKIDPSIWD